ncbi:hypothetical protein C8F04DRAFT_1194095 [Mycena alexandri]|uniref:Uncharacterized protein n=1 Tax=Mycena alexandri TaxID=1745969 RepID=A0AAD6WTE4_9AGAR|nr:hypothetical protein C8F04DRAFT_1194095 [Mycena alexandri]
MTHVRDKYAAFVGAQASAVIHFGTRADGETGEVWFAPDAGGSTYNYKTLTAGLGALNCAQKIFIMMRWYQIGGWHGAEIFSSSGNQYDLRRTIATRYQKGQTQAKNEISPTHRRPHKEKKIPNCGQSERTSCPPSHIYTNEMLDALVLTSRSDPWPGGEHQISPPAPTKRRKRKGDASPRQRANGGRARDPQRAPRKG